MRVFQYLTLNQTYGDPRGCQEGVSADNRDMILSTLYSFPHLLIEYLHE